MLTWLVNNLATIIVGLALLAVVILIVRKLRSDKKKVNLPVVVIAQDVQTANIAIITEEGYCGIPFICLYGQFKLTTFKTS